MSSNPPAPSAPDAATLRRAQRIFASTFVGWFVLDQVTKALVVARFGQPGSVFRELVPGYLELTFNQNSGAAFSMLRGHAGARLLLIAVATTALALVFAYRRMICALPWPQWLGLAFVAAGAAGNLYDRILRGGLVVDFIRCHIRLGSFHYIWPDFNVADMGVTCGMLAYVAHALWTERAQSRLAVDGA